MHQDAIWYGGRPHSRRLCVRLNTSSLPKKAHVYCGQTAAWIKMPLCSEVGLCQDGTWLGLRSRPHCARWQPQLRSPKRGQSPQFSVHFCCGQTAGWIKMPLGTEVGLGPDDIALDGDQAPPPPQKKGHSPQFSASVRCGQMAGWTKMPHGVEVGLGPGDFVFDGDSALARKKGTALHPVFGLCLLWPNGSMSQDATWYGGKPRTRRRCVRWGRSPLKWAQPPSFWFMSVVAKRLDR